jgi:hypothetical protein
MTSIYLVTSLPRSGTMSLTAMANICGIKTNHVLGGKNFLKLIENDVHFFSDTPFYSPEFLLGLLETLPLDKYNIKFIYSHRDQESWSKSFSKLINRWKPMFKIPTQNKAMLHDVLCYNHITPNTDIVKHYQYIKEISNIYKIPLLDYTFSSGWTPFCNYLGVSTPDCELPWLHKSKRPLI